MGILDSLYLDFGLFVNSQWSMRFDGVASMDAMNEVMAKIRGMPLISISKISKEPCQKYDLNIAQKNNGYEGLCANVVIFESPKFRLIVRPSGTEPKIKFYLELHGYATDQADLAIKRSALDHDITDFRSQIDILLGGLTC